MRTKGRGDERVERCIDSILQKSNEFDEVQAESQLVRDLILEANDIQDEHGNQCFFAPDLSNGADTLNAILKVVRLNRLGLGVTVRLVGMDCAIASLFNVDIV